MRFTGIPGVSGIGEGEIIHFLRSSYQDNTTVTSWEELIARAGNEFRELQFEVKNGGDDDWHSIINVQVEILNDPVLSEEISTYIQKGSALPDAVRSVFASWKERLQSIPDGYLSERVQDLKDLEERLLRLAKGGKISLPVFDRHVILAASELFPSELLQFDRRWIRGLVLGSGSISSHIVLLAKAFRIPTVLGAADFLAELPEGERMRLDGSNGEIVRVSNGLPDAGQELHVQHQTNEVSVKAVDSQPCLSRGVYTADGIKIKLLANLDIIDDLHKVKESGAQGVGLFRTEFIYLAGGAYFSEEDELEIYKDLFSEISSEKVVVRLLDLGSDKPWPGVTLTTEANPALGIRGIRLLLKERWLLERQLRVLFRAVGKKQLSLLLPMVGNVSEIKAVHEIINIILQESPDVPYPKVGAMVEIPAIAMALDSLKSDIDFISLGTNDLTQYGMALDRALPGTGDAWLEPGMFRLLEQGVKGARRAKLPLSVCGELAGTIPGAMALIGLGVRKLSMTPTQIPAIRDFILRIKVTDCQSLAKKLLKSINKADSLALLLAASL